MACEIPIWLLCAWRAEEEEDDEENDETVMDEVDAFLEENDSGLTDADKEVAKGG